MAIDNGFYVLPAKSHPKPKVSKKVQKALRAERDKATATREAEAKAAIAARKAEREAAAKAAIAAQEAETKRLAEIAADEAARAVEPSPESPSAAQVLIGD